MKGLKLLMLTLLISSIYSESRAQTQEILGGNILNGAITGSMLGTATMGLQNSGDFAPLRIGLGAGILGGVGVAAYDMASKPEGTDLQVSGFFNSGSNTSILILLDTIYGAAGGALIGTASMLIADQRIAEGLQYGASAGAWTGFAFGLFDAFFLAEHSHRGYSDNLLRGSLIQIDQGAYRIKMMNPTLYLVSDIHNDQIQQRVEPALGVLSVKMHF